MTDNIIDKLKNKVLIVIFFPFLYRYNLIIQFNNEYKNYDQHPINLKNYGYLFVHKNQRTVKFNIFIYS